MKYNVVALSGSIQKVSLARNILRKCQQIAPSMIEIHIESIEAIPLLNVDLFDQSFPKPIEILRQKVMKADALLFVSTQFFGKVSPAMKNAYDWLSYSPNLQYPSPLKNIPAALISIGERQDGSLIQKHFLQMGQFCRVKIMSKPNLHYCTLKKEKYGQKWQINEAGVEQLRKYLEYLSDFINKKRKSQ